MGSGTADGVQTPGQQGVIVREGENFPPIPPRLLKLTPAQLQAEIDSLSVAIRGESRSPFYSIDREEKLIEAKVVREFAKTAVERRG